MLPVRRIPTALGYAVASAVLVGVAAEIVVTLLPEKRFVAVERERVLAAVRLTAVAWAAVAGAVALGARRGEAAARAALVFGALAVLPLCKTSLAWKLAAGRLAYPAWLFAAGAGTLLVFFRRELAALARRAGPLAWMVPLSAALVLVGEAVIDRAMVRENGFVPENGDLAGVGLLFARNTLLVLALVGLVHPLLNRPAATSVLVSGVVLGLAAVDVVKLAYLKAPLNPFDVLYLGELRAAGGGLLEPVWLVALVGGFVLCGGAAAWCWRLRWGASRPAARAALAMCSSMLLVALAQVPPRGADSFRWDPRRSSLENGLLAQLVIDLSRARVVPPPGYGREAVLEVLAGHAPGGPAVPPPAVAPDVVVVMVESLMDPLDLSRALPDPLPRLRALARRSRSGRAISPSFGGLSANAEFELLTGLSMRFLPRGSLPYEQYLRRELPALPREFAERGYRTCAVLADPPTFYDRPRCYPLLGFEETRWLERQPDVERAQNGSPSDRAIVDAVLAEIGGPRPSFVFAFTNATHAPYSDPGDGRGPRAYLPSANARRTFAGYAAALAEADAALDRLATGLAASQRPSVLLVVGDHLPPFPGPDGLYEVHSYFQGPPRQLWRRRHAVLAVLARTPADGAAPGTPPFEVGMSYLGLEVLAAAGLEPRGHWAVLAALREPYPIVSRQPIVEVEPPDAVRAYALLQYDLLFGARYLQGGPAALAAQ